MASVPTNALFVVGTRPEAIKMLPLIRMFRGSTSVNPVVVSTGQHAVLVAEVLALGGIAPDVTFPAPDRRRSLNELFADVMLGMERFFRERFGEPVIPADAPYAQGYPGACFVHGDTTSAAAAALASFHLRMPVVHVEAGLRTSNTLSPFPEELNRQLISRIAAWHLAPTSRSRDNLIREGVSHGRIYVSGNTGIDALQFAATLDAPYGDPRLDDLEAPGGPRLVVVTAHRRENWGKPLGRIASAVRQLAEAHHDVRFVVALHPNPDVAAVMRERLSDVSNVSLVAPLGYAAFAKLLRRAYLVLTDSGGIQEEAPSLGTPVIVLRDSTEREEGVDAGTLEVVGTRVDAIVTAAARLLDDPHEYAQRRGRPNPYGDGRAAERILRATEHILDDLPAPRQYGPTFDRIEVLRAAGSDDPSELLELVREDDTAAITIIDPTVELPVITTTDGS
ncbi:non-hydrolyzing UDP-N-acetylglucosamine 2-epimerase [Microbacterium sp. B2969]|uniref:UDP-N-acetylglucosamine 2-epimerase (non-hydrolyzing) n=1 Tax=Microbacterium alkaliflavum TaxID=3248839 RepID=A0ABW7Q6L9_9MICO